MVSESLIQVVELRLDKKEDIPKTEAIIEDYEKGLILAPYFDEGLERFEARQDSFQEFVPELIHGIQLENEKEHADRIHRLKADLKLRSSAGQGGAIAVRAQRMKCEICSRAAISCCSTGNSARQRRFWNKS